MGSFGSNTNSGGTGNSTGSSTIDGIWQAMEHARASFERRVGTKMNGVGARVGGRVGTRVGRGDVRAAIIALLAEQPMHGYQIIHEIEERSGGTWKPSPGSVYPTLQLLSDEGLIAADESNGRKTYALTDDGRAHYATSGTPAPWASTDSEGPDFAALPKAGLELAQAAAQVGRTGKPAQIEQAVAELEAARRRLYAILAQD